MSPDRSPREHRTDRFPVLMFSVVWGVLVVLAVFSIVVGFDVLTTLNAAHAHSAPQLLAILHNQRVICERTHGCPVSLLQTGVGGH